MDQWRKMRVSLVVLQKVTMIITMAFISVGLLKERKLKHHCLTWLSAGLCDLQQDAISNLHFCQ